MRKKILCKESLFLTFFINFILFVSFLPLPESAHKAKTGSLSFSLHQASLTDGFANVKKGIEELKELGHSIKKIFSDISELLKKIESTIGYFTLLFLLFVIFFSWLYSFLGISKGRLLFFLAMFSVDWFLFYLMRREIISENLTEKILKANLILFLPFFLIWFIHFLAPRLGNRINPRFWFNPKITKKTDSFLSELENMESCFHALINRQRNDLWAHGKSGDYHWTKGLVDEWQEMARKIEKLSQQRPDKPEV